jgi:transposase
LGNPLRVILSAGQITDIERAEALIKDQPAEFIVADKGYDSDAFVETISAQGAQPVIPPRSNRINPRSFDRHLYKSRNLIERFFSRIKQFRRIATRYDKLAKSFMSFVHLACAFVWLA